MGEKLSIYYLMFYLITGLVPFRFLAPIPPLRTRAFQSNLTIDCTTNDPNVTTKLYVRYQSGLPWKQVVTNGNKVLKRGQVYIILKFALYDIGQYQCHAINAIGDVITSTGMVYGYKQNIPKLRLHPHKQQVVKIGSSSMIACISDSYVKLKWFKVVNRRYRAVPRYQLTRRKTHNEFRLVLRLNNIIQRDEGTYMCRMKYMDKVQEKFIDLKINKIYLNMSISPKISGPLKPYSNHTITCSTKLLSARLQWFRMVGSSKTYTEIPRERLLKIKNNNENKLILKLSLIDEPDAGVYKCTMKYHGKKRTLLTALDVGFKPRARSRKAIVIQRVGSRLSLPCRIMGLPLPTVTWTKDGRSIGCLHDNSSCNLDKRYIIRNKFRKDQSIRSILRVKGKIVKRDQGLYRCVAMNKYGVHRSVTRVVIVT
ncbi:Hemicentin-1 [Exaiptasia diaphana]|nr:Hemicentin-1 [Exaiptasia diaphana]